MRLLRVQAVFAQKVAWVLVLLAAAAMPLAMHLPWLTLDWALQIPVRTIHRTPAEPNLRKPFQKLTESSPIASTLASTSISGLAKPSAAHRPSGARIGSQALIEAQLLKQLANGAASSAPSVKAISQANRISISSRFRSIFGTWERIRFALLTLYGLAAGILLLRTLAGLGIAGRIWLRSRPLVQLIGANGTRIRVSPDLSTPVTIGSTVILPAEYDSWDEAKLRIVLAHEQSHVHQGDFYLQLAAAVHVAVFWFSPLGWWLQRKLSELGEALSDRAGLEQASNPASYAEVLLEFAAQPRRTRIPLAGVAMARNSNISSRIERVLNARLFQVAFLGGRRHAILAAVLVPTVLVAAIVGIRFVPQVEKRVEAARGQSTGSGTAQSSGQSVGQGTTGSPASAAPASGQVTGGMPEQITSTESGQSSDRVLPLVPPPPPDPAEATEPADAAEIRAAQEMARNAAKASASYSYSSDSDDGDAFAIVHENSDKTIRMNGTYNDGFAKARKNLHGTYIWFEHDGKSYVITDPAFIARSEALFKGNAALDVRMKSLNEMQAKLNLEMAKLEPIKMDIKLDSPEFKIEMDKLQVELKELQNVKIKEITDKVNVEVLEDLQSKMGDIQGQIGEIQGKIGEKQGQLGEKQGEIGERMGKLGEEMGKIGEQQGKIAEEASRKIKPLLDQAIKDGKAKPVN